MGRKRPTYRTWLKARWLLSQEPGVRATLSPQWTAFASVPTIALLRTPAMSGAPPAKARFPPLSSHGSSSSWWAKDGPAGTCHAVKRLPAGTHCLIYKGGWSFWSSPSDYSTLHCGGSPTAGMFPVRVYYICALEDSANWNTHHDLIQRARWNAAGSGTEHTMLDSDFPFEGAPH